MDNNKKSDLFDDDAEFESTADDAIFYTIGTGDLTQEVLAFVKATKGLMTTENIISSFEDVPAAKWGVVRGILMHLMLEGKITLREDEMRWDEKSSRHWHIIEWSDVMTEEAIKQAVKDQIDEEVGQINAIIAAAGTYIQTPVEELCEQLIIQRVNHPPLKW